MCAWMDSCVGGCVGASVDSCVCVFVWMCACECMLARVSARVGVVRVFGVCVCGSMCVVACVCV